jgi:PEP-CTERM motif
LEQTVNAFSQLGVRKATALALLTFALSAKADVVFGDPLVPTLPDLNRECFEDLSKPSEPESYTHWLSERKGDDEKYSFEHTAGLGWTRTSTGYGDEYTNNEWHYEPKGGVFGNNYHNDYDFDANCAPVPEPQTWALMMMGLLGLVALRRTKGRFAAE